MRRFTYLIWPSLTGILAVILLSQFAPNLFVMEQPSHSSPVTTNMPLQKGPVSYADAVAAAAPAVVNIYTRTLVQQKTPLMEDPFYRDLHENNGTNQKQRIESSLGSGVILSPQGYIATNNHVVEGADSIVVALRDGREALASLVGSDPETDLAVLKIDLDNLPSVEMSNTDNVRVGDVVLAIGNPFGVGQTVTIGIVSATDRNQLGLNTYENFIQTDAAVNPGNSGGALINANGQLVGINTVIFSKSGGYQGIGFAIPANLTRFVMEDLVTHGRVIRGWLGLEVQELTPALAESFGLNDTRGLIVAGIYKQSPADIAGVEPGDVIVALDGLPIFDRRTSMDQVAKLKPGDVLNIEVLRNGNTKTFAISVIERPRSLGN
ncbi:MAG: S1C family serine protease [Pontibacterium sp.]